MDKQLKSIIFCPYITNTNLDSSTSKGVEVGNFKVPFFWGELYDLTKVFYYGWSSNDGMLVAVKPELGSTGIISIGD